MYDIIEKKRDKYELTKEEIYFFVNGYSKEEIPDYQMSALLMAIFLNGMTREELVNLTFAMRDSSKEPYYMVATCNEGIDYKFVAL